MRQGFVFQVIIFQYPANLRLVLPDRKLPGFRIIVIAKGNPATVPLAVAGPGYHGGGHTLGRHISFKLRKYQDDFEHSLTYGRGGIKLLVFADKDNTELLQFLVHFRKVQQVTGNAVYFPDKHMRKLTVADAVHHILKGWPVGVLS